MSVCFNKFWFLVLEYDACINTFHRVSRKYLIIAAVHYLLKTEGEIVQIDESDLVKKEISWRLKFSWWKYLDVQGCCERNV